MKDQLFKPAVGAQMAYQNRIRILNAQPMRMYTLYHVVLNERNEEKSHAIRKNFVDGNFTPEELQGIKVKEAAREEHAYIVYHYGSNRLLLWMIAQGSIIKQISDIKSICQANGGVITSLDITITRTGTTQNDTEYKLAYDQKSGVPLFEATEQRIVDFYEKCKKEKLIRGQNLFRNEGVFEGRALMEIPKTIFMIGEGKEVVVQDFYDAIMDEDVDRAETMFKMLAKKVNPENHLITERDAEGKYLEYVYSDLKAALEELRCPF